MPDTIKILIAGIRDYIGNPDYARLSNPSILNRLHDKFDFYRAQLNLTNQNWFLSKVDLNVSASQDEFVVNASGWGRPILVTTKDDSDTNHITREIPIVTVQDADIFYSGSKSAVGTATTPHVATSVAFFKSNGQVRARVKPQHNQSATYEIWYQPDRPTPPRLADNFPLLEAFENLLKVDTALSCLPKLMIIKDGVVVNAAEIAFYERRLESDKMDYKRTFDLYKNQSFLESAGHRSQGYGEDDMEIWSY